MRRRGRGAAIGGAIGGAIAGAAIIAACTQVSTAPGSVLALQLFPPALPSIVLGDELHDLAGNLDSLHAVAFNNQGQQVDSAPIRFLVITGRANASVDSVSGRMLGTAVDTLAEAGTVQVIAYLAGALQTLPQTVFVVFHPDGFSPLDSAHDSIDYNKATGRDTTLPLSVRLFHVASPADTLGVPHYRLQYAITYPAAAIPNTDPTYAQIVNAASQPQLVDTTVVGGNSTLGLHMTLLAAAFTDTVGIDVFAYEQDHTPVPGSPVHFVIALHIH
jgi:hypothetical protein